MAIGVRISRIAAVVAVGSLLLLLLAAGPGAPNAEAANACAKHGTTKPTKLKLGEARGAIRCFLNRERSRRGLSKLKGDSRLTTAAQRHNDYMQKKKCFSHVCPGERDLAGRLSAVGYLISGLTRWAYGENIAWGGGYKGTPKSMVKAWMNSSGHRANILNPTFRDIGIGFTKGSPYDRRENAGIYTTDFGLRIG